MDYYKPHVVIFPWWHQGAEVIKHFDFQGNMYVYDREFISDPDAAVYPAIAYLRRL